MKPFIGISVDIEPAPENDRAGGGVLKLNRNYVQAVADAGGIPLIIPPMADAQAVGRIIHGWLIPGGMDIDASLFGEVNHPEVQLQDPQRYEAEASLYRVLDPDLPVLGICYGCQFLNVVRGGSLVQHLPDAVGTTAHEGGTLQSYELREGSQLAGIAQDSQMSGKSYHHQAVGKLGSKLEVSARAEDGTVEAVEANDRPWLVGVQWHPERTLEDPATRRLFETFIARAREYAEGQGAVSV